MHPIRLALFAVFLATTALFAPAPAFGQSCEAPPGRAGLVQYCETIPGPGGDRGPGDFGRGGGSRLPSTTREELNARGATGRALLGFAEGTGGGSANGASARDSNDPGADGNRETRSTGDPAAADDSNEPGADGDGDPRSTGDRGSTGDRQRSEPSNNPLTAIRAATESGSSVGPAFLWALLALALVVAALGWVRYRRGGPGPND
jgi:hypothetical protein